MFFHEKYLKRIVCKHYVRALEWLWISKMSSQGFIYLQNILLYHQVLSVLPAISRKCVQRQGMYLFSTQITLDPAKDSKIHVLTLSLLHGTDTNFSTRFYVCDHKIWTTYFQNKWFEIWSKNILVITFLQKWYPRLPRGTQKLTLNHKKRYFSLKFWNFEAIHKSPK